MHIAQVESMNVSELLEFLGDDKICGEDGCYRECASGYTLCIQCLHGTSERAHPVYVAAKKRLRKLQRKEQKESAK